MRDKTSTGWLVNTSKISVEDFSKKYDGRWVGFHWYRILENISTSDIRICLFSSGKLFTLSRPECGFDISVITSLMKAVQNGDIIVS